MYNNNKWDPSGNLPIVLSIIIWLVVASTIGVYMVEGAKSAYNSATKLGITGTLFSIFNWQ